MSTPKQFMLQYLELGWSVIPLEERGKTPLVDWQIFTKRLPTTQEVEEWTTKWPNLNIGLVTGTISGLSVVDIDGPEGMEQAKPLNLPQTVSVKTGRGLHLYYKHPGVPVKTCRNKVAPKIDIRGDGGYVVAPYSTHDSGSKYAWLGGFAQIKNQLTPFPQNVLSLLGTARTEGSGYSEVKPEAWVSELLRGVGDGEKHTAVIRLAGYFSAKGLPVDVATKLLLEWNTRNKPPAEPKGIIERVEDVYRRYSSKTNEGSGSGISAPLTTTASASFSAFKAQLTNGCSTISTGFPTLDRYSRGLLRGNLSVIGAWPGVGKTAFTITLARSVAERKLKVAYFPTEMSVEELMRVLASSALSIPFQRIMDGQLDGEEHERIEAYLAGEALNSLHFVPINTPSLPEICAAVKDIQPDVFFVDYLQHTKGSTGSKRTDVEEIVMGLKELAQTTKAAGVITSQFHRPYKSNDGALIPPTMFDFAECGQIEREVSMALLMSPVDKERYSEATEFFVNFNLAKNRFGKIQEFQLKFNQEYVRYSE